MSGVGGSYRPNNYGVGSNSIYTGTPAPGTKILGQAPLHGGGAYINTPGISNNKMPLTNEQILSQISGARPQGFQYAGAPIAGQMFSNTTVGGLPSQTTNARMRYNPFQFLQPETNFTERNPYQFDEIQGINVADTFNPNMALARREIEDQRNRSYEQMLSSLNSRGMATSGALDKANFLANQELDRNLADSADRFAIAQGQAQTQEDQMRRSMEYQRQVQQAEEIFKQQGASDDQARYLAEQSINVQGLQANQNLAGFQTNLGAQQQQYEQALARAQMLMAQQNQQFQQTLSGRQQATSEEQLANLIRRQPLEDLYRVWAQQAGPTGPQEGSAGVMGLLAPLMGMGLSFI